MGFLLYDLDQETRRHMAAELRLDMVLRRVVTPKRLNEAGRTAYQGLLEAAIDHGDSDVLAAALSAGELLDELELSHSRKGKPYWKRVPWNVAQTLAEGEFNRYYMRGLARRAIVEGIDALEVYRAKSVKEPRAESRAREGYLVRPAALLEDLRSHREGPTDRGLPAGPNSGMSVRIPLRQERVLI